MCLNKLLFGGSFYSNLRVLRRFLNFSSVGFLGICIKAQLKCAALCRCGAGQDRELLTRASNQAYAKVREDSQSRLY